jgi:hypothetical protein
MTRSITQNEIEAAIKSLPSDLTKIELPHGILSLKQQVQRLKKEY